MKRLAAILWVAILLALVFPAWAIEYKTVDIRRTGNSPVRESFYAGDSIAFGYYLTENGDTYDLTGWQTVTWEVCSYTNPAQCWMSVEGSIDDAENGEVSVATELPRSVLPEGQYRGYVRVLNEEDGAVESQRVVVEQVVTVRYGNTELSPDLESNEGLISEGAYVRQNALDEEILARIQGDAALSNALAGAVAGLTGDIGLLGTNVTAALEELQATVFDEMQGQLAPIISFNY